MVVQGKDSSSACSGRFEAKPRCSAGACQRRAQKGSFCGNRGVHPRLPSPLHLPVPSKVPLRGKVFRVATCQKSTCSQKWKERRIFFLGFFVVVLRWVGLKAVVSRSGFGLVRNLHLLLYKPWKNIRHNFWEERHIYGTDFGSQISSYSPLSED